MIIYDTVISNVETGPRQLVMCWWRQIPNFFKTTGHELRWCQSSMVPPQTEPPLLFPSAFH